MNTQEIQDALIKEFSVLSPAVYVSNRRLSEAEVNYINALLTQAAAQSAEKVEGLEEAVAEGEGFEDYLYGLKAIIMQHHPKCTCNANLCEWCAASIAYDEGNKYFPILHEAARRQLAAQRGGK